MNKRLSTLSRGQRSADVYVNDRGFYPVAFRVGAYTMPTFVTFWDRSAADSAVEAWLSQTRSDYYYGTPVGGPANLDRALSR